MPGRVEQAPEKRAMGDSEQAAVECAALEVELVELKASYEQFFLGVERAPPTKRHAALRKRVLSLKGQFIRQTAIKFRIQTLAAKLATYERLWERSTQEIEAGTYRRDLFRAKRHRQAQAKRPEEAAPHPDEDLDLTDLDGDLDQALAAAAAPRPPSPPQAAPRPPGPPAVPAARPSTPPAVAAAPLLPARPPASPGAPPRPPGIPAIAPLAPPRVSAPAPLKPVITPAFAAAPAPRPVAAAAPPVSATGGLTDQKIKAIYEAYLMAKKRCGEDTRSLTLDSVATSLKKQVPELMRQHQARSVEFKVVIKDGRAVLRALPKDG